MAKRETTAVNGVLSGEWLVDLTNARQRRVIHYWFTLVWFTRLGLWIVLRDELWFVGFMSLYAIWFTHLAGWAAETPVEPEPDVDTSMPGENVTGSAASKTIVA